MLAENVSVQTFSEADIQAAREESYKQGQQERTDELTQQLVKRQEQALKTQEQMFSALAVQHEALIMQFGQMLPTLAMEAVRRVLATVEIDEAMIRNIVSDMLAEVHPGSNGLEVCLNQHDLELFLGNEAVFEQKYPGISFIPDGELKSGDCIVRSRFGTLDGRVATKLNNAEALME